MNDSGMTAAATSRYRGAWTAPQFTKGSAPVVECTENPHGFHVYRYKRGRIYCQFCGVERM